MLDFSVSETLRTERRDDDLLEALAVDRVVDRRERQRRGAKGRIKASRARQPGQLAWSFYEVPAGWENEP